MPDQLAYPLKSHRKLVTIPPESLELAELLGIIYGDGGIGNPWQLVISLNSISDLDYSNYIVALIETLFQTKPAIRKRPHQNTLVVVLSSITLIDFLIEKGAVKGNKLKQITTIPRWIRIKKSYSHSFIRGLIDTDGCLYLHNHCIKGKNYVNIGLCFTNFSPQLVNCVDNILKKEGLKTHITDNGRRIYLYSAKEVKKYLTVFGSSNPRILTKYQNWRSRIAVHSTRLESARA